VRLGLLWEPSDALRILLKGEYNGDDTDGYATQPVRTAFFAPADPYTIDYNRDDVRNEQDGVRTGLEVKYQLSPNGVTLRLLTGYQRADVKLFHDLDALPFEIASGNQDVIEQMSTQEVNLLSPEGQPLEWVLGVFYFKNEIDIDIENVISLPPPAGGVTQILTNTVKENIAGFAHAGYEFLPGVKVEGGIRYSHDDAQNNGLFILSGIPIPLDTGFSDGTFTGKAALNWIVNPNHFLYAFAARGYKSGGSNAGGQTFDGETVWDYEIGWKATLFDGHVRTQINGFYMDYNDLQIQNIDTSIGAGAGVVNAGSSSIKGFEAQLQARYGGLGIDGSVGYVDSSVTAQDLVDTRAVPGGGFAPLGPQCAPGQVVGCFDYAPFTVSVNGRRNPFSPEWTFNAGVEYAFDLGDAGVVTPRVDYSYTSDQFTTLIQVIPSDFLASREVWNAQLRYEINDWSIVGFVTNFTNETFVTGQMQGVEFYNAPRQYGARVERRF
jgi:iron complex outermembrane receptor protein